MGFAPLHCKVGIHEDQSNTAIVDLGCMHNFLHLKTAKNCCLPGKRLLLSVVVFIKKFVKQKR